MINNNDSTYGSKSLWYYLIRAIIAIHSLLIEFHLNDPDIHEKYLRE